MLETHPTLMAPSSRGSDPSKLSVETFALEFFGEGDVDPRVKTEFYEDYLRGACISVRDYERATLRLPDEGALFPLGQTVMTPGAQSALEESGQSPTSFLRRHQAGDWGELDHEDSQENCFSLGRGLRLLSVYRTASGEKLYVITEADRSCSTILLTTEY